MSDPQYPKVRKFLRSVKELNDNQIDNFFKIITKKPITAREIENLTKLSTSASHSFVAKLVSSDLMFLIPKSKPQRYQLITPQGLIHNLRTDFNELDSEIGLLEIEYENSAEGLLDENEITEELDCENAIHQKCSELIKNGDDVKMIYESKGKILNFFKMYRGTFEFIEGRINILLYKNQDSSGVIQLYEKKDSANNTRIMGIKINSEEQYEYYHYNEIRGEK